MDDRPDLARLAIPREEAPAASPPSPWRWVALVATAIAVALAAQLASRPPAAPAPAAAPTAAAAEPARALPGPRPSTRLDATGYVVAQRKAAVASKATGRLRELRVKEGDRVKRDDVLAVIENEDLAALVAQAQAALESARARVRSAQAELDDARLARERVIALRAKSVASPSDFDTAVARWKKATASEAEAAANVGVAQAQLDRARVDLDYSIIRAPFDGTVLTKDAEVGEIVAPFGSSATARAAVVTIADMGSLQVEADISENHIARVREGLGCVVTLDALPGREYRGVVDKVVPTVDRAKGTVLTKIRFLVLDPQILPDMSAKVTFTLEER